MLFTRRRCPRWKDSDKLGPIGRERRSPRRPSWLSHGDPIHDHPHPGHTCDNLLRNLLQIVRREPAFQDERIPGSRAREILKHGIAAATKPLSSDPSESLAGRCGGNSISNFLIKAVHADNSSISGGRILEKPGWRGGHDRGRTSRMAVPRQTPETSTPGATKKPQFREYFAEQGLS